MSSRARSEIQKARGIAICSDDEAGVEPDPEREAFAVDQSHRIVLRVVRRLHVARRGVRDAERRYAGGGPRPLLGAGTRHVPDVAVR